jgi:F420-dependent oxidoreductase-like protein
VLIKIGLQVLAFNWPGSPENIGPRLAEIGRAVDEAGFDSLWVMDHFFQMDMPHMGLAPEDPMLDGYTALSYLAALTSNVTLGTMVTGVVYRQPAHLLKIVSNLDVLSGGRAYLGIGAAWYEREARGLGFPFPPLKERFERLEETLRIAKQMWSGEVRPFNGKHYQLAEPINNPMPLSRPHPPILIGGTGENKTLRLVAQYGNACNFFSFLGHQEIARKLNVLKSHCDALGRDYAEIERTTLGEIRTGGPIAVSDLIEECRGLAGLGIQHAIFNMPGGYDLSAIATIGREVIPEVHAI